MKQYFVQLCTAAALMLGCASVQAQSYQLVWGDEFNGKIGPDWVFETGGGKWGNNEREYYQVNNASVNGTDLMITARKENVGGYPFTSARMKTKGRMEFTYGKIEARIKMPMGQGLWPAFWMLGANIDSQPWPTCGEIDIMEHVNSEDKVYATQHWDHNGYTRYGTSAVTTPADYHIYTTEWDASTIRTFVDGTLYHTMNIAGGVNSTEEFHKPFFLLLNLAVGGDWPGQTVDESKLPATMHVDYVRVYQLKNIPPPPTTGTKDATFYKDCGYAGSAVALEVGDYTTSGLSSRSILNNDVSSLKVMSGYEVQLFDGDNFMGTSVTLSASTDCFVASGWNDRVSSLKVRKTTTPVAGLLIQAENYGSMSGVQLEATADAGGGQNVGYIDTGDWLSYHNVNFPTSGTYTVEYRVASVGGGQLSSDLNSGNVWLGNLDVPATGGWQNWTTISQTINVSAGMYDFGVFAHGGGWNLNWVRITKQGAARGTTGSPAQATALTANVYPNPSRSGGPLLLELNNYDFAAPAEVVITDLTGREVLRRAVTQRVTDLGQGKRLQGGSYLVRVRSGSSSVVHRLIVQ